nr:PREDICTED: protein NLP7-like [Daucus carota subsp. sativus]
MQATMAANSAYCTQIWSRQKLDNVLIQIWEASREKHQEGREYWELKAKNEPFYVLSSDDEGFSSYRIHSLASTVTIKEDGEDDDEETSVIAHVFMSNRPEMSPKIEFYSVNEYSHKDFALTCGIRASLCLPLFKTVNFSGRPDGVMELVSTCDQDLEKVKLSTHLSYFLKKLGMYSLGDNIYRFIRTNTRKHAMLEMDHLLEVICQTFRLPLAQYWVIKDANLGGLEVMYQSSHRDFENIIPWCQFKDACLRMGSHVGEGPVGKTYLSQKSLFCRDITELTITNHPLAHYAQNCGSIACFTICLWSLSPQYRECVLEFFLPSQEMDSYYPQTLLNSLLTTMKENLLFDMVASEGQLGEVLLVEVINSSGYEPETFKIGQPVCSLADHEDYVFQQGTGSSQLLFEDGTVQDEHVRDIEKSNDVTVSYLDAVVGDMTIATPDIVEIDNSALEIMLEDAIKQKEHTVVPERDDLVEQSPEDSGYAMTPGTDQPSRLEDLLQKQNEGIMVGLEEDDTTVQFKEDTSEREKQLGSKDITFEGISELFGRPLEDAAKSFGVSRSTLKRKCRGLDINDWRRGKQSIKGNMSSDLRRRLNDDEQAGKNFHSGLPSGEKAPAVDHISQTLNEVTVRAMYNGVTIRFDLSDSSGIAELENNVIERLHLERESFSIKYRDDEDIWILIACDKDVRKCIEISRSLKRTSITLLVDPPINHRKQ